MSELEEKNNKSKVVLSMALVFEVTNDGLSENILLDCLGSINKAVANKT